MIPLLAIKTALGGAWGFISKLPAATIVIAVLCALSAFLWHNADGWKAKAERCATGRAADIALIQAATKRVTDAAIAAKAARETHDENIRKEADAKLETAKVDANARLAEYIRTHRVRTNVTGNAGNPDLPQAGNTAQVDNGPGAATVMVSADDLAKCTENTTKLVNAQEWWASISNGSAVK